MKEEKPKICVSFEVPCPYCNRTIEIDIEKKDAKGIIRLLKEMKPKTKVTIQIFKAEEGQES